MKIRNVLRIGRSAFSGTPHQVKASQKAQDLQEILSHNPLIGLACVLSCRVFNTFSPIFKAGKIRILWAGNAMIVAERTIEMY